MKDLNAFFAGSDIKVKANKTGAPKFPLFYMSNTFFRKCFLNQENWFNGFLLDFFGNTLNIFRDAKYNNNEEEVIQKKWRWSRQKKTQALKQNDLEPLFVLHEFEI